MVKLEDYVLLMFSHIKEKLTRDVKKLDDKMIEEILNSLVKAGYLEDVKGKYGITQEGKSIHIKRV